MLTDRATPTTLGKSPSKLLMNRQPRTRFSALRAKSSRFFKTTLITNPSLHQTKQFLCVNLAKEGAKLIQGTIVGTVSPQNFEVQVRDIIWKQHQEQLHPWFIPSTLGSG